MQQYKDWEWIVVNDGSTDNTLVNLSDIAKKDKRVKLISYKENKGRGYARKVALENCIGDWIAIWDIDDLYFPERLNLAYKASSDGYDYICSYAVLLTNDLNIKGYRGFHMLLDRTAFIHATVCAKADLFKTIGYNEIYRVGEDFTKIYKLAKQYNGLYYKDYLLLYQEDREINLKKAIQCNSAHYRQLTDLFKDKTITAKIYIKFKIIYLVKLALLNTLRIYPSLYLKTVKMRDNGKLDCTVLPKEKTDFIAYFKDKYAKV